MLTSASHLSAKADHVPEFEVRLAQSEQEILFGQALRYQVFVKELGADGPLVDHHGGYERDAFDPFSEQLLLLDHARAVDDQVVGVYRLMDQDSATAAGQFYSETEYELSALRQSGRRLLELGRSCIRAEYRSGAGLMQLWQGLAAEVRRRRAEVLFGVASFQGTDVAALAQPLSLLHRDYLAPPELRVRSKISQNMDLLTQVNRLTAMKQTPALIKAYLRLGGFVGDGVFVDHAFNTTDVCLVLDTARMNPRQRAIYAGTQ